MIVDFSKSMSIYELIAIIISVIALLIRIIELIWKKWVVKPILEHLSTGDIILFINKSGSYVEIDGVFEAKNKPISVKNVALKIIRQKDDKILNLDWSTFRSPINQKIIGVYASTMEAVHPFRIEADGIITAFIEFSVFENVSWQHLKHINDKLSILSNKIGDINISFEEAYKKFKKDDLYKDAKLILDKECFWDIGTYEVIMEVEYNKRKIEFLYTFNINSNDYNLIKHNIDETLCLSLKDYYRVPYSYEMIRVKLENKYK